MCESPQASFLQHKIWKIKWQRAATKAPIMEILSAPPLPPLPPPLSPSPSVCSANVGFPTCSEMHGLEGKGVVYHMVRSCVVPVVSVGPPLTRRDAAMLFLHQHKQQEGREGSTVKSPKSQDQMSLVSRLHLHTLQDRAVNANPSLLLR